MKYNTPTSLLTFKATFAIMIAALLSPSMLDSMELIAKKNSIYAITNASVININTGRKRVRDILVRDGRVVAISLPAVRNFPEQTQVIEASGKFIIPGLWDAHAHIAMFPEDATQIGKLYIANGITNIRDMGGPLEKLLELKHDSEKPSVVAPRMWIAGPIVEGTPRINHGGRHKADRSVEVNTPAEAVKLVDNLARKGVDFIKPYHFLSPEVFTTIVQRARHYRLPIAGHIPSSMTVEEVIGLVEFDIQHTAGNMGAIVYDGIRDGHVLPNRKDIVQARKTETAMALMSKFYDPLMVTPQDMDPEKIERLLQLFIKNGTWNTPTLGSVMGIHALGISEDPYIKDTRKYQCKQQRLANIEHGISDNDMRIWGKVIEKRQLFAEYNRLFVGQMHKAGVKLLAGGEFGTNGFNIHLELQALVKAGLTPLAALQTATLHPAEFFKVTDQLGSVEVGKLAEMIILDKNPLIDINNTRTIRMVISKGQVFDRKALDKILDGVAKECSK